MILVLCLCIGAGLVIAGCTQQTPSSVPSTTATLAAPATSPAAPAGTGSAPTNQTGMANPASVNCVNVGGQSVIMTNPDGSQYGMCNFTNGTSCEEWALFRGEGCKAGVTGNQTGNATAPAGQTGMANPASVNCVNVGGTVQIKDSPAGQYGMCVFPNGTTCEEWALFRGEGCEAANVTA
ncbi:MAG: DUF333 domain-containing protein [Methanoregula sp.]|uniref:putative hemolysin n=1 Tax=Methanoregula sp. TaxID=2052170 RepID=UPI003C70C5E3